MFLNFVFRLKFLHKNFQKFYLDFSFKEVTKPFIWGILFFILKATWDNKQRKIIRKSFLQQDEAHSRPEFINLKERCFLFKRIGN